MNLRLEAEFRSGTAIGWSRRRRIDDHRPALNAGKKSLRTEGD